MKNIRDNFGWIKDIAIVCGMCAVLYLNLNYVTNTKFESFVKDTDARHESVQKAIISIDKSLMLLQQNNKIMLDMQTMDSALAAKIENVYDVQRGILAQQKLDMEVNIEFKTIANIVHKLESEILVLESSKISEHFSEYYKKLVDIEYRMKLLESKTAVSPK